MPSISNVLETPSKEIFSTLGTQSHLETSERISQSSSAGQAKTFDSERTFNTLV